MIVITGSIDLDPAQRDAALAAAIDVMAATRAEAGCERYVFSPDVEEPGRIHLAEQWTSEEALEAHLAAPHVTAFLAAAADYGVTDISITRHDVTASRALFG